MKFFYIFAAIYAVFLTGLSAEENVYDKFFSKANKTEFNDTMFERVIWHKKVSFLVIESLQKGYHVTMLVVPESPYNFKGTTYPLHYFFLNYNEAFKKFIWLDSFLKKKGVLKVKIQGSNIVNEKIMISESN
jgi:hypothetical protein